MSKSIIVELANDQLTGSLNETKTAQSIFDMLPVESAYQSWGAEIYFEIPLHMENEHPTTELEVGDLAYWPSGNALCVFFGSTPASENDEPRPASPVTVVGKLGNPDRVRELYEDHSRIKVKPDNFA